MNLKMTPINNHVRIQPLEYSEFVSTERTSYEEIGVVLAVADGITLPVGAHVYFDGWLAKKYPVQGSEPKQYEWYVDFADIVAYEAALPE